MASNNETLIYHNPRCSKSRASLQLLQEQGINADVVEYLKTPPDKDQLIAILKLLALQPRELMRKNETIYKELALDNQGLSDEALIQAMLDHPQLIERPIIIHDGKAVIGRPPQRILEILS